MSEKNESGSCGVVSNGFEWLWIIFHRGEGMTIKSVMFQPPFKLGFIGLFAVGVLSLFGQGSKGDAVPLG